MIVCNLVVIVTYIYRVFLSSDLDKEASESSEPGEPTNDDDFTSPAPPSRGRAHAGT